MANSKKTVNTVKKSTPVAKKPTPAKTTPSTTTSRIGRVAAAELIKNSGGKFFTVTFASKTNTARQLTGQLRKEVATTGKKAPNVSALGMIRVYDMLSKGWRTVNTQTISSLKLGGRVYNVR